MARLRCRFHETVSKSSFQWKLDLKPIPKSSFQRPGFKKRRVHEKKPFLNNFSAPGFKKRRVHEKKTIPKSSFQLPVSKKDEYTKKKPFLNQEKFSVGTMCVLPWEGVCPPPLKTWFRNGGFMDWPPVPLKKTKKNKEKQRKTNKN